MKITPILITALGIALPANAVITIEQQDIHSSDPVFLAKQGANSLWQGGWDAPKWSYASSLADAQATYDNVIDVELCKVTLQASGVWFDPQASVTANANLIFSKLEYEVQFWQTTGALNIDHIPSDMVALPNATVVNSGNVMQQVWVGPGGFQAAPFILNNTETFTPPILPSGSDSGMAMTTVGLGAWIGEDTNPLLTSFVVGQENASTGTAFSFAANPSIGMEYSVTYDWKIYLPDEVIPEPSVYGAGGLIACLGLVAYRRRMVRVAADQS